MADPVDDLWDGEGVEEVDVPMASGEDGAAELGGASEEATLPDVTDTKTPRISFLEYLRSPIVTLAVGSGSAKVNLTAHTDLLTKSPYFEQACAGQTADSAPLLVELPDEDVNAMGAVLEYLYLGDYFPKRIGEGKTAELEEDPSVPSPDHDGTQLLRHARIYTLAEKLQLSQLKSLAHTKIHRTTSTARGEIAYARYVYSNTPATDTTIRRPVAAFWATRSHVLRHEAEEEFRAMCLEYPQFGFDVLSIVLDHKERKSAGHGGVSDKGNARMSETPSFATPAGRGKKRPRISIGGA